MSLLGKKSKDAKKKNKDLREKLGVDQKTMEDIEMTFHLMDKDHSGSISHAEFKEVMASHKCRPTDREIQTMILKADKDNSGAIEFEEFAAMLAAKYKEKFALDQEIKETFARFDTNKDGYVCRKELQKGLEAMGEKMLSDAEADDIIRSADKDGDGVLCMQEFAQYIFDNQ